MPTTYPSKPTDLVEEILVSAGCDLKTQIATWPTGKPGDVYESRVCEKKVGEKFALAVYEYGDIDTAHKLFLINLEEKIAEVIKWHNVSSPSCFWGRIEIIDLKEEGDEAIVKYRIAATEYREEKFFEERYSLQGEKKVEVKEEIIAKLKKLS